MAMTSVDDATAAPQAGTAACARSTSTCTTRSPTGAPSRPYVPAGLRWRIARQGGPPLARHGFKTDRRPFGDATRHRPDGSPHPAAIRRGSRSSIWTRAASTSRSSPAAPQPRRPAEPGPGRRRSPAASTTGRWTTWVRPFDCYKGSILIAPAGPRPGRRRDRPPGRRSRHGPGADGQRQRGAVRAAAPTTRSTRPACATTCRSRCTLAAKAPGCRRRATAVGHPTHLLRVVRLVAAELHGAHHEHGDRRRLRALPDAQGRAVRGRHRSGCRTSCGASTRTGRRSARRRPGSSSAPSRYILEHFYSTTYPLEAAAASRSTCTQVLDDDRRRSARCSSRATIRTGRWAIRSR